MKNIIPTITVITFLVIALTSIVPAMAISNEQANTAPVPEVIACESTDSCEMTTLESLIQLTLEDEGKKAEATIEKVAASDVEKKIVTQ